jgi:hypothetical protein
MTQHWRNASGQIIRNASNQAIRCVTCPCEPPEGNPVCELYYDNLTDETVFSHSMSGLGNNVDCSACPDLNTTYVLNYNSGCCWLFSAPHCVIDDGGVVTAEFCPYDTFTGLPTLTFRVSRVDSDADGSPSPSQVGTVFAIYEGTDPGTPGFPSSMVLNLSSSDTDPGNGPCTFSPPSTVTITKS